MNTAGVIVVILASSIALSTAESQQPSGTVEHVWTPDSVHSLVSFRVRHLGLSWVNGEFREWGGQLIWNPEDPATASVTVRIATASVTTRNDRRDNDLRQNYLQTNEYPEITFVSRTVDLVGDDMLKVGGDLTIHGTTRPVILDVEIGGTLSTPRERRSSFTATTAITRQDFGIVRNFLIEGAQIVGDEVRIQIDLEATAPARFP
jgi:polyisoprenoid-binding protein YceI